GVSLLLKVVLDQVEDVFLVVDNKDCLHRLPWFTARSSPRYPEGAPSRCPGPCRHLAGPASAAGGPSTDRARLSSSAVGAPLYRSDFLWNKGVPLLRLIP